LECAFGVVGKILMSKDLMEFYLVRFGFRMWEIFKVISASEDSNKFPKKTRFWKEKIG
jgi:hypothetical protein